MQGYCIYGKMTYEVSGQEDQVTLSLGSVATLLSYVSCVPPLNTSMVERKEARESGVSVTFQRNTRASTCTGGSTFGLETTNRVNKHSRDFIAALVTAFSLEGPSSSVTNKESWDLWPLALLTSVATQLVRAGLEWWPHDFQGHPMPLAYALGSMLKNSPFKTAGLLTRVPVSSVSYASSSSSCLVTTRVMLMDACHPTPSRRVHTVRLTGDPSQGVYWTAREVTGLSHVCAASLTALHITRCNISGVSSAHRSDSLLGTLENPEG